MNCGEAVQAQSPWNLLTKEVTWKSRCGRNEHFLFIKQARKYVELRSRWIMEVGRAGGPAEEKESE